MLKIYGSSDDRIEVEGDIDEEFGHYSDDPIFMAVSDGTLLRIVYDEDGIWRITRIVAGAATFEKTEGDVEKDTPDIVTLFGDTPIKFVVLGKQLANA